MTETLNPTTRRTPAENTAEAHRRAAAVREARRAEMGEEAFAEFEARVAQMTSVAVHHVTCGAYMDVWVEAKHEPRFTWEASPAFGSSECLDCCPSKRAGVVSGFVPGTALLAGLKGVEACEASPENRARMLAANAEWHRQTGQ